MNGTTYEVGSLVIVHGADGADRLAQYRGQSGSSAFVFDAREGFQAAVPLASLRPHALSAAVAAARASGASRIEYNGQWVTFETWLGYLQRTAKVDDQYAYDLDQDAIVDYRDGCEHCLWSVIGFDREGEGHA